MNDQNGTGTCQSCRHRQTKTNSDRTLVNVCVRFPPTPVGILQAGSQGLFSGVQAMWPAVDMTDRCGEYTAAPVQLVVPTDG